MSSISGTTTRLSGLASTLDTDTIVEELMKVSEIKVDEVKQQQQVLEWKQEFYQDITKKLYDFQKEYFNDSVWSDDVSNLAASYNSEYISITTSSNSTSGNIYIQDIVSVASAAKMTSSSSVSTDPTIDINTSSLNDLAGKSIVINLDGVEEQLTFSAITYSDSADVQTELQSLIDNAFGSGKVSVALDGEKLSLSASNSTIMLKVPTDGSDASSVLAYDSYASNRLDLNVSLSSSSLKSAIPEETNLEFEINGLTFNCASEDTLAQIMTKVNSSSAGVKMTYSALTDKFSLTSSKTGAASGITFSDTTGALMSSIFGTGVKTNGTDSVVKLSTSGATDGSDLITLTRSTNTIEVDGTTITLKKEALNEAAESINISLAHDTDAIYEKITSFIDDYNTLLATLTSKASEEYDSDYLPLTDAQREEMSETEIKDWEIKAKTGLLANDIYLNEIASSLRSSMYSQVSKLGDNTSPLGLLSEIGITTSNYSDKGKLTVDKTKLKAALNSDSDKVTSLFTQKSDVAYSLYSTTEQQTKRFNESGIFNRLSDIMNKNLSTVGKKGALITLVGSPTASYTGNSDYATRISDIKEKIEKMEDDLADEEDRYYTKFTAMETAIAKLNQQSSWITNMLSGS